MQPFIPPIFETEWIKQQLSFQFSITRDEINALIPPNIKIELSKKTKRLKYIYLNDKLWLILRPNDGSYLLTPASAIFLVKILPFPKLRVIVQSDVAEFIQKGGNVFAKHVVDFDPAIIPYSEVIVVNERDVPLAIGRAILTKKEAIAFAKGIAVKVRKGIPSIAL